MHVVGSAFRLRLFAGEELVGVNEPGEERSRVRMKRHETAARDRHRGPCYGAEQVERRGVEEVEVLADDARQLLGGVEAQKVAVVEEARREIGRGGTETGGFEAQAEEFDGSRKRQAAEERFFDIGEAAMAGRRGVRRVCG